MTPQERALHIVDYSKKGGTKYPQKHEYYIHFAGRVLHSCSQSDKDIFKWKHGVDGLVASHEAV